MGSHGAQFHCKINGWQGEYEKYEARGSGVQSQVVSFDQFWPIPRSLMIPGHLSILHKWAELVTVSHWFCIYKILDAIITVCTHLHPVGLMLL